tara:strand:- start:293 stop:619 length:327 start_codon:yes stop_codon:yes gene_type:complete
MIKKIALEYFHAFSNKDIDALCQIFDVNVSLRDWDINAEGIDAVLDSSRNIFSAVESIHVTPVRLYEDGHTIIAELVIDINSSNQIKVIDVIEFTDRSKIIAIRAYKG